MKEKRIPVTEQYRAAFEKHYPQKNLSFMRDEKKDVPAWFVVIDGDRGDFSLTIPAMFEAINLFNR